MPRGGSNYIPRPDGDFNAFINNYVEALTGWWGAQGFDLGDLTPLTDAQQAWGAAYRANVKAQASAQSATEAKDAARTKLEQVVRPLSNFVQSYPATTDADRAWIGITVRDTSKTPSPVPTTRPLVSIAGGGRLTHELKLVDSSAGAGPARSGARGGKPAGVTGAEVWVKLVPADQPVPTDPNALSFLTLTTRSTLRTDFRAVDGGKTAVYMLRWVNTRGEKGPWSEIATATVAA